MSAAVLIIDDDPVQRRLLKAQVVRMGLRPIACAGGAAGLDALRSDRGRGIATVVLDLLMPGMDGIAVLAEMRRLGAAAPVIVQTAKGGIETVVEAMRAGAFDFVVKPASPERLQQTIGNAVRMDAARRAGASSPMREKQEAPGALDAPASAAMRPVLALAAKAARSTIPILIEGETGVGKEWLAEAIRAAGPRAKAPFVAVNCGALPPHLVESILFGHEKGAFTDADARHRGKFVEADGGTLFLDEIGELPAEAQVKLLRVLQNGEVDPVGGRAPVRTDVRIVSATNRDLAGDVRAGRFREDLYYRLNVLSIHIPPLRERRSEIAGLATRFLRGFVTGESGSTAREFSGAALALLQRYDWPGNIRQLQNVVHRAVVLAESTSLEPQDFPQIAAFLADESRDAGGGAGTDAFAPNATDAGRDPWIPAHSDPHDRSSSPLPGLAAFDAEGDVRTTEAVEADLIRLAMARYRGRMSEIARRLGIGRSTLYRKMRQYSIAAPESLDRPGFSGETLRETGDL